MNKWITVLVFVPLTYNVLEGCSSFVSKTQRSRNVPRVVWEHRGVVSWLWLFWFRMKESICARSLPLWSGSYRPPGMEQRGSIGVRREHGFREAQSIPLRLNTRVCCCFFFFLMSLSKWTKVVIKLISCVNFFFFFACGCRKQKQKESSLCKLGEKSTVVGLHTGLNWPNWPSRLYLQLPWNCKQMLEPSFNGLPHLLRQHAAHQSSCN